MSHGWLHSALARCARVFGRSEHQQRASLRGALCSHVRPARQQMGRGWRRRDDRDVIDFAGECNRVRSCVIACMHVWTTREQLHLQVLVSSAAWCRTCGMHARPHTPQSALGSDWSFDVSTVWSETRAPDLEPNFWGWTAICGSSSDQNGTTSWGNRALT